MLSRRRLLVATGAALPALTLTPSAVATAARPDLSTSDGWLTWIRAHRDQIAIVADDGRGQQLTHRAHVAQPLASAVKVIHLAAYATAVAEGRLNPQERVRIGDWERFYVPADGGAHVAALRKLGIPIDATGLFAADPDRLVTVDDMVAVMIEFSDSGVPDYLRNRLGDPALHNGAHAGGWDHADIRSLCAEYLFLALPEHAPPPGSPLPLRRAIGDRLERRYSTDTKLREQTLRRLLGQPWPPYEAQCGWASATMHAAPRQLATIHQAIAAGTFLPRQAAGIAREHLERPFHGQLPPGAAGVGLKAGSLPGVLTAGMSVRRTDGSAAAGSWLAHGDIAAEQLANGNPALPLLLTLTDPAWRDRLARALRD